MLTESQLKLKSVQYRKDILRVVKASKSGHTGGDLSCIDILNVLYNRILRVTSRDVSQPGSRLLRSEQRALRGGAVRCACRLRLLSAERSGYPEPLQFSLYGHPTRKVNGVEQNTGALGHGLAFAVGVALAAKRDRKDYRVFTLLGDGELAEGSNWEAGMTAAHYRLDNLVAIVDRNGLQITGSTEDVVQLEPLEEKFEAFGFAVRRCDGNDIADLLRTFESVPFTPGNRAWFWRKPAKEKE